MSRRSLLFAVLVASTSTATAQVPAGGEFQVNSYTTGAQSFGRAGTDARGRTVVVWHGQDGTNFGVFGRILDPSGSAAGAEFQVNTNSPSYAVNP